MAHALDQLTGLSYAKGHATGNDFVLISDPQDQLVLQAEHVAALADRHFGLGGDGVIRAVPTAAVEEYAYQVEAQPDAYWFMDYRNADGSIAEMCGNGVRLFVHFLIQEQLVDLPVGSTLQIGSRAGVKQVTRLEDGYAVNLGPWGLIHSEQANDNALDSLVRAHGWEQGRPALSITMGNPHAVVALAEMQELSALDLSVAPAVDPVPEHGTNVEFVVPAEPLVSEGIGAVTMRVHERGVGETLSCGTGACAAAAAVRYWAGSTTVIDDWVVNIPGGQVGVAFRKNEDGTDDVILSGPAVLVGRGVLTRD
ncbi:MULTISPECIES: diaminopimelate epimerase [Glutamicibacter]|uniref:Diaminopimelate epimerase n=1 Tax=Glutamicibacter creatinolyticus TaxID=162496 RepID=A0A5B7WTQ5_9MICC|nr:MULTISPECIES: diaminopimelate epimerase [Glutamicibacter]QCY46645.1 Diaminopimelate epimerase [Glutamicibacter creatinolyticus]TLK57025.1 diaminopimelate epimerase [Glutamicibacter sp. V16R2B1]